MNNELIERVAKAIENATIDYSIRLTRLVDDDATYTAICNGETREFECHDDAAVWVDQLRRAVKAKAVIAAIDLPAEREAAARAALDAAAARVRTIMIAEMSGLLMESPYRAGIKWCGERSMDAIRAIDPAQFREVGNATSE